EIIELKGDQCNFMLRDRNDPLRWLLVQAQQNDSFIYDEQGVPRIAQKGDKNVYMQFYPANRLLAFSTWPGPGSEPANVGLCKFQRTVAIAHRSGTNSGRFGSELVLNETEETDLPLSRGEWQWRGFCKTQYANEHGLENFLQCHLAVIAILDTAKKLGF